MNRQAQGWGVIETAGRALMTYLKAETSEQEGWLGRQSTELLMGLNWEGMNLAGAKAHRLNECWEQINLRVPDMATRLLEVAARDGHPQHAWMKAEHLRHPLHVARWLDHLEQTKSPDTSMEELWGNQFLDVLEQYLLYTTEEQRETESQQGSWIGRALNRVECARAGAAKHWAEHAMDWLVETWIQTSLEEDPWEVVVLNLAKAGMDMTATRKPRTAGGHVFQNRLHEQLWIDSISGRDTPSALAEFMINQGVDVKGAWDDPVHGAELRHLLPGEWRERLASQVVEQPLISRSKPKL